MRLDLTKSRLNCTKELTQGTQKRTDLTNGDSFHDAAYLKASYQRNVAQFNNKKSQRTTIGK
jgi:hypothetical protein